LAELGTIRAFVVHGADGLDEISNTGESRVSEVREGGVRSFTVRPEDFGMPQAAITDLRGGDREQNAQLIRGLLDGEAGPKRDIVLMNSAAALVAGARASLRWKSRSRPGPLRSAGCRPGLPTTSLPAGPPQASSEPARTLRRERGPCHCRGRERHPSVDDVRA